MYVLVDLAIGAVELVDPDATHDFSVVVAHGADIDRVAELLATTGAGSLVDDPDGEEPEHAWISLGWIREAATGRVAGSFEDHLSAMVHTAGKHGWLSEDGGQLRGHVAWPNAEEPEDEIEQA